jgi:hypothetical protein
VTPGWNITWAYGISEDGLILAEGTYNGGSSQYLELAPNIAATPEPGTIFLACAGAFMLLTHPTRKTR